MSRKKVRMWVDPSFKKIIKKQATDRETTILDLTKDIAKQSNTIEDNFKKITETFQRIL